MHEITVEMTIKQKTGENERGYGEWATLAEFALPADGVKAFEVYALAFEKLVQPTFVIVEPS